MSGDETPGGYARNNRRLVDALLLALLDASLLVMVLFSVAWWLKNVLTLLRRAIG